YLLGYGNLERNAAKRINVGPLASYSHLWLINLRLLVLPYALCFDYSMGCVPVVQSWTDFRALALPAVVAVVLVGTYVLFKANDR
ncbi:hypothetical protein TELCIR_25063, partial [Teladorsagia circumcincta]